MHDLHALRELVARTAKFHVSDRSMRSAQRRIEGLLAGGEPSTAEISAYLVVVERYFAPFDREARGHLAAVERQLQQTYQVQFNLSAEREVAQRRIEATQGVLRALTELRGG